MRFEKFDVKPRYFEFVNARRRRHIQETNADSVGTHEESDMRRYFLAMATAAMMWTATGCAKPFVVSADGPAVLPTELRTYAILDHDVGSTLSTRHVFQTAIHEVMAKKGYLPAPRDEADLHITFKALLADADAVAHSSASTAANESTGGSPVSAADVSKVVLVQVEDSRSDRVIWVGWSAGEFRSYRVVEKTRESVEKILERLPNRG